VQITGALAPRVRHFTLFQRTAQWVMPVKQMAYTQEQRDAFRGDPSLLQRTHDEMQAQFNDGFATAILDRNSELMDQLENICSEHLETAVKDPVLREKLRPSYRAGCKRLVISHEFYDSIQGVNTELVTEPIQRIEAGGVRTVDGRLHELDVLVLATGFQVDRFVRPMRIQGRDGALLDEVWKDRPSAYMALAVPGFPNFFMLNGPNSPVGNFSLIQTAELQFAYVMRLLREARSRGHHVVEPSAEAAQRFEEERTAAAKETVWATGCRSWYLDDRGIPFAWPFPFSRFREEMGEPRVEDYRLE
jgi:cation diffusion facilitator CzcD-associated flavoprotein CzcO